MTDHAESASVTVRVVHGSEAVSISLAAQSSVRVLKERLQELHPQRPSPVEQKLIFGGRVLDDARVLSEVFANSLRVSDVVSVHLILNGSQHHATAAVPATSEAPRQPTTIPAPSAHLGAGSFGLTRRVVTVPCIYINGIPYAIETQPALSRPASPIVPPTAALLGQARNGGGPAGAGAANREPGRRLLYRLPMALLRAAAMVLLVAQHASTTRMMFIYVLAILYVLYSIGLLRLPARGGRAATSATDTATLPPGQRTLLAKLQSILFGFFFTLLPVADQAHAAHRVAEARAQRDRADGAEGAGERAPEAVAAA